MENSDMQQKFSSLQDASALKAGASALPAGCGEGIDAQSLPPPSSKNFEATMRNMCLLSVALGMLAVCLALPLMLVNFRAGIVALFIAMVAIPSGFGGAMIMLLWSERS